MLETNILFATLSH